MSELIIELCPETGICSLVKADGSKIDLMPDEVVQVRAAAGNANAIKEAIGQIDAGFAGQLDATDLAKLSKRLK